MQCNRLVLAAETRTRAYYTSMCELQHPRKGGNGSGLQPIIERKAVFENEWSFLSLELCGGKSFNSERVDSHSLLW